MADRRRSRTLLAVFTLVALVLITIDYRLGDDGFTSAVRRGAVVVFSPVQEGFAAVVRPVGSFVAAIGELGSLREQNTALEAELNELTEQLPSVANLERENAELRELLEMRERLELTTSAARVIGQPPGEQGSTVLVDTGADQGVEVGMAVLSARGLVGKVTEVTASHARVELLTSPSARYAVRVAENAETGLLRGQGADPFQLELLDPEAEAEPGDEVVTRTFQASTIPDGLPIGEIIEEQSAGTSERFLLVRPYVDFRRLSFVQVVLDAPEAPADLDPDEVVEPEEGERPDPPSDPDGEDADDEDAEGEDADDEDADGGAEDE